MPTDDTSMGGSRRAFPSTVWSRVLAAADPADPAYREGLDALLRAYWKPVFAYVRAAWRKSVEDAKDLTQAFFCHLLEKEFTARIAPGPGSFRAYLKRCLRNFMIDAERAHAARRPEGPVFSLPATGAELERLGPATPDEPPERAYDRLWFRCVLDASVEALGEALRAEAKEPYFEAFRAYCLSGASGLSEPDAPTYDDVASRLGIKKSDVRNYLTHCRARLREIMRERIREYAADDEDAQAEFRAFLKG